MYVSNSIKHLIYFTEMAKRQSRSIFISSTFSDLEEIREQVTKRIGALSFSVVEMEHFPVTSKNTLENSLEQLMKGCDYYILLIGHKYGTIPEGEIISITHAEYRKALELKAKKELKDLFIFIGSDDFLLRSADIEKDFKREKLKAFIDEVKSKRPTYHSFSDVNGLLNKIDETLFQIDRPTIPDDAEIFDDFEKIRTVVDADSKGKTQLVNRTLNKILDGFSPVFRLQENETPDLKHPIVTTIKGALEEAIPNLSLDTDLDGRVESWGIRHVIFRIETAIKLMMAIKDRDTLFAIGQEIGRTASNDLFDKVIDGKKKVIPASLDVFIKLFDYWDSSAGWGTLSFEKQIDNDETTGKWILLTENNFLTDKAGGQSEKDINHLYTFWEGYITGALNEGLSRLSSIYSSLSLDLKKKIEFPIYIKITKVERQSRDSAKKVDVFYVFFEKHTYGWALESIANIREKVEVNENQADERIFVLTGLAGIISQIKSKNKSRYNSVVNNLTASEKRIIRNIENHKNEKVNVDIQQCIGIVNLMILQFI